MVHKVRICALAVVCAVFAWACESSEPAPYWGEIVQGATRTVGTFKNGKKHGPWWRFYAEELVEVCHYRDGKKYGPVFLWTREGLYADGELVDGRLHGRYRIFFSTGRLAELGWHDTGSLEGTWCHWRMDGSLESVKRYRQGELVDEVMDPPGPCPLLVGDGARHADPADEDFR